MAGSLRTRSGRDGVKARISRREHGGSGSGARENVSVRKTLNGRLTVDLTQLYRYKLAEKLSERLDEMGKDLTSMIEEVNSASASLSKTNRADEPVCQTSQPYHTLSQLLTHFLTDLPNCPHSQLAPVSIAGHRSRYIRAAG